MFGAAAAIAYAFTAALIKTVSDYAADDWVTMFEHWQTYGVAVFGLLGLFLTQNAFHAGPLAASQSTLVLVDPLVSICLGIALYGDTLRTGGPYGPLEAVSLLVMFIGAVFLSNSPLVTGMKSEGKGRRVRRDALPPAQAPQERPGRRPAPLADQLRTADADPPRSGRHRSSPARPPTASSRRSGRGATGARRAAPPRSRNTVAHRAHWRPATPPCAGGAAPTLGPPIPNTAGTSSARDVEGRALAPQAAHVRHAAPARRPAATRGPPRSAAPTTTGPPCGRRNARPHHPGLRPSPATAAPPRQPPPAPAAAPAASVGTRTTASAARTPRSRRSAPVDASAAPITTSPPRLCPTRDRPRAPPRTTAPGPSSRLMASRSST